MPDETKYDLDYRPASYWELDDPVAAILNRIQGEGRRRTVEAALAAGETVPDEILEEKLSSQGLDAISAIHPSLMGGEFLPELRPREVEIARVVLASATCDVISLRARQDGEWIRFRVVDEYYTEGVWYRLPIWRHRDPLTMREVIRILDGAKQICCREDEFVGLVLSWGDYYFAENPSARTAESYRDFATVSSGFYPQLAGWFDEITDEWYREKLAELGETEAEETSRPGRDQPYFPTWTLTERLRLEHPDQILQLTDPPMTESEAREIVRRLRREGRLPSPEQIQKVAEEILTELETDQGEDRQDEDAPSTAQEEIQ
ncbi:MAG: hypothetical protein WBG93_05055 [Thermoanaerobaculia bacterium]